MTSFSNLLTRRPMAVARDARHADSEYDALFDPVTRLPGRPLLRDRLEVALARATRVHSHVGVLFVDVIVPDDLAAGRGSSLDVLPLIAGRLRSAIRPDDTVARVGDTRFVVVCNEVADQLDLATIAQRLDAVISVRIYLDESRSVLHACIDTRLASPGDDAVFLLTR
jgi:diguanylate cyclase (GGDEF)-like protein